MEEEGGGGATPLGRVMQVAVTVLLEADEAQEPAVVVAGEGEGRGRWGAGSWS